ncbi:unnamed protein product [Rangifer tarandus platyrhynchus]|uniref:RING-type domain-containing protein n=1 Tax=Rangifer tarandus platyrhynchus TaxID=3082113 RepID=A0ABN8ZXC7_RANTA|nr:unnamed protein product [Rangifer tarandus platyrhynchus]
MAPSLRPTLGQPRTDGPPLPTLPQQGQARPSRGQTRGCTSHLLSAPRSGPQVKPSQVPQSLCAGLRFRPESEALGESPAVPSAGWEAPSPTWADDLCRGQVPGPQGECALCAQACTVVCGGVTACVHTVCVCVHCVYTEWRRSHPCATCPPHSWCLAQGKVGLGRPMGGPALWEGVSWLLGSSRPWAGADETAGNGIWGDHSSASYEWSRRDRARVFKESWGVLFKIRAKHAGSERALQAFVREHLGLSGGVNQLPGGRQRGGPDLGLLRGCSGSPPHASSFHLLTEVLGPQASTSRRQDDKTKEETFPGDVCGTSFIFSLLPRGEDQMLGDRAWLPEVWEAFHRGTLKRARADLK